MKQNCVESRRQRTLVVGALLVFLLLGGWLLGWSLRAEVGAFRVVPWQSEKIPEHAVTLSDLEIEVEITGGFALVRLRQTFENHTAQALKGEYFLKLPPEAMLMDFGVWDEGRWSAGVVIERRRGRAAFQEISERMVDPALLEAEEAEVTDGFKVSLAPLPAYGTRRVEIAFHQWLPVREKARQFLLPLAPGPSHGPESADRVKLSVTLRDFFPLATPKVSGPPDLPLTFTSPTAPEPAGLHTLTASFEGGPVRLTQDLAISLPLKLDSSQISFQTFRDPDTERLDLSPTGGGKVYKDEAGYFLAEAILQSEESGKEATPAEGDSTATPSGPGLDVVILLDTSLSMQFEKLTQALEVMTRLLNSLRPSDNFGLVLMNDEVKFFKQELVAKTQANVNAAIEFVRATPLGRGTRLLESLNAAHVLFPAGGGERKAVLALISDGDPTVGELKPAVILQTLRAKDRPREVAIYAFGLGEDTNVNLLAKLANESGGYFTWARETEDIGDKLTSFLSALRQTPARGVSLSLDPATGIEFVYPAAEQTSFPGESLSWSGRYLRQGEATLKVAGARGGKSFSLTRQVRLPEKAVESSFVKRLWAQRRVAYLLEQIELQGEKPEWVAEIIALSREFKFPTPYTSFLVAPRAYLRPRVIQPSDPVLTVKAEPGTRSILALFPFGEVHAMQYEETADQWETRFIAPAWMKDGRYYCELVITDSRGVKRLERKEFTVDSSAPSLQPRVQGLPQPGQSLVLLVDADPDTRWIKAQLAGLPPVEIKWDPKTKINRGQILLPLNWPPGEYVVRFSAEDFAHNLVQASLNVRIGGAR